MKAILVLEDGSLFEGTSIGTAGEKIGEVVLNTAVVGYQEIMTDPANAGKILVLTYPLIGNYGVAGKFNESKKCWLAGLAIKESSRIYSNWQAEGPFEDFLKNENVLTISDIDTRTVAITIRDKGEMLGIISTKNSSKEELLAKLKAHKKTMTGFIKEISVKKPVEIKGASTGPNIAVLDLGITNSCLKQLSALGCSVTLLPYDTAAKEISGNKFDGLIISSGPENDKGLETAAKTVKELLGKIPMLGFGAGHETIAMALGAGIKKLKIGHHGVNYPVLSDNGFKGEITIQNHSYTVDEDSLKRIKGVKITLRSINDKSIAEVESVPLKFISAQYNPASPGFDEVNSVFLRFLNMTGKGSKIKTARRAQHEVEYAKA